MSRHLVIVGTYKNGKKNIIGAYNPKNSELKESKFIEADILDLQVKLQEHIKPKLKKFKSVHYILVVSTSSGQSSESLKIPLPIKYYLDRIPVQEIAETLIRIANDYNIY